MRRYGFIAAGGGPKWSLPLRRLNADDRFVAYQKGAGYVGYGRVVASPVMAKDFMTPNGPLLEQALVRPALGHDRDDPDKAEYTVAVAWEKTLPVSEAVKFDGMFANQHIVCKLRDDRTIEVLKEKLGVSLD